MAELDDLIKQSEPSIDDLIRLSDPGADEGLSTYQKFGRAAKRVGEALDVRNVANQFPAVRAAKGMVDPMTKGFNTQLANTLGLPLEMVNEVIGHAEKLFEHSEYKDNPGEATAMIKKAFKAFGVDTYEGEAANMLERIGEEGFRQLLFSAGLRGAAPALRAPYAHATRTTGMPSTGARMGETVGRMAMEKPATLLAAGVTSAPGIPMGEAAGEWIGEAIAPAIIDDPTAQGLIKETGKTLGGFVGGSATSIPGVALAKRARLIPKSETDVVNPYQEHLVQATDDPNRARLFADEVVKRETTAIDKHIVDILQGVGRPENLKPKDASTWLHGKINAVKEMAREMEREAWDMVSSKTPIKIFDTYKLMDEMENALPIEGAQGGIPYDMIKRFKQSVEIKNADGKVVGLRDLTFDQMRRLKNVIMDSRWATQGSAVTAAPPNTELRRNLQAIENSMMENIDESLAAAGGLNKHWEYARALSQALNDRFTRGPIGQLLGLDFQNTERITPDMAAEFLLSKRDGFNAVTRAGGSLPPPRTPPVTDPNTGALMSPAQPAGVDDMRKASDIAIRNQFVKVVEEAIGGTMGDPKKQAELAGAAGNRFAQKVSQEIEGFTATTSRINKAITDTKASIAQRRDWENSATARFAGKEPHLAVKDIFASGNPEMNARRIMRDFEVPFGTAVPGQPDPSAAAGLGKAMIDDLIANSPDPRVASARLSYEPTRKAFVEVLGDVRVRRLEEIIAGAIDLDEYMRKRSVGPLRTAVSALSTVFANWAGHTAALASPSGGYGALSYPAKMQKMMQSIIASHFGVGDPMKLISESVYSRDVEALLRTQLPSNMKDAEQYMRLIRRVGIIQNTVYDRMIKGHMNKYRQRQPAEVEPDPSLAMPVP
jgi:hypothetical protein